MIDESKTVHRSEGLVATEVDGEMVVMSIERGNYYGLNDVGSRIWHLIETPLTFGVLCDALAEEYAVDAPTCKRDVANLLEKMDEHGLVWIESENR